MKLIIDKRYVDIAKKQWGGKYEIIPSFSCEKIQKPVSAHPDMTLTQLDDVFVCSPDSYEYYRKILGDSVKKGKAELSFHYPNDIAYNVLIYKDFAFAKAEYTDSIVKEELKRKNIKLINVNQGYAKCSSAVCKEGIITADESIYSACVECGIDVLRITPGHIELSGYDYGFIGGASGLIDGKVTFFGDISKHPDHSKIKEFCNFDYFGNFPLTDVGTIMCI